MDIAGRIAIVTGGASGIGRAVCEVLAEAGARGVVIADVDAQGAAETRARIEADTAAEGLVVATDVSDEDQVAALVAATIERFGRIDILVNNDVDNPKVNRAAVSCRKPHRESSFGVYEPPLTNTGKPRKRTGFMVRINPD